MLHKKSEYRLQYNKLNEDLRRQIWQDNITLRKSRLLTNQATHYWEYQLRDDPCDCHVSNENDSDDGPEPPHRQKHKELRQKYKQHLSNKTEGSMGAKDAREAAVQTPEWAGDVSDTRLQPSDEEELRQNVNRLTLPEAKDGQSSASRSGLSRGPRTARSQSRPSRTTRKLATEPKQTHFVPFGWNEKTLKVGNKLTYNVCAPKKEVHDSALQASQRRKAEVEDFLVAEKCVKHQSRTPRERICSNASSTWMSEYQEQFSARSRTSRPLSAPPAPRPPISWRHS